MLSSIGVPSGWTDLAGMLAALSILGGVFTWIVSAMIDRKMTALEKAIGTTYVTKESLAVLVRQADLTEKRQDQGIRDIWISVNDMAKERRHDAT